MISEALRFSVSFARGLISCCTVSVSNKNPDSFTIIFRDNLGRFETQNEVCLMEHLMNESYNYYMCTGCMLCIGQSHYFRFNHPVEAYRLKKNLSSNYHEVPKNVPGIINTLDIIYDVWVVWCRLNGEVIWWAS